MKLTNSEVAEKKSISKKVLKLRHLLLRVRACACLHNKHDVLTGDCLRMCVLSAFVVSQSEPSYFLSG